MSTFYIPAFLPASTNHHICLADLLVAGGSVVRVASRGKCIDTFSGIASGSGHSEWVKNNIIWSLTRLWYVWIIIYLFSFCLCWLSGTSCCVPPSSVGSPVLCASTSHYCKVPSHRITNLLEYRLYLSLKCAEYLLARADCESWKSYCMD